RTPRAERGQGRECSMIEAEQTGTLRPHLELVRLDRLADEGIEVGERDSVALLHEVLQARDDLVAPVGAGRRRRAPRGDRGGPMPLGGGGPESATPDAGSATR